jgi:AraC-like DNA-binding protein
MTGRPPATVSASPAMEYRELSPGQAVTASVATIWTLRGSSPAPAFDLVLPDGHAEIIAHRAGRFREWRAAEAATEQPVSVVAGVSDRAVLLSPPAATFETIGIRVTPYGLARLSTCRIGELTGRIAPAAAVLAAPAVRLIADAAQADSLDEAVLLIQRGLHRLFDRAAAPPPAVVAAVRRIQITHGAISVEDVLGETGVTARTLERQFAHWVGLSPKRYARVVRFHAAISRLIAAPDIPGALLALQHGYYDQAHFTRDMKAFTGWAPRAFVTGRLGELTRRFAAAPVSDSSKTHAAGPGHSGAAGGPW